MPRRSSPALPLFIPRGFIRGPSSPRLAGRQRRRPGSWLPLQEGSVGKPAKKIIRATLADAHPRPTCQCARSPPPPPRPRADIGCGSSGVGYAPLAVDVSVELPGHQTSPGAQVWSRNCLSIFHRAGAASSSVMDAGCSDLASANGQVQSRSNSSAPPHEPAVTVQGAHVHHPQMRGWVNTKHMIILSAHMGS